VISTEPVDVPQISAYEVLARTAKISPSNIAYEYLGHKETYSSFKNQVDDLSLRFRKMGVLRGDRVAISLPNCPQALVSFYALSRLGAVAVMVHPLSSKNEIEFYIKDSKAKMAITLGKFTENFPKIGSIEGFQTLIVTSPVDMLPWINSGVAQLLYKDARMPKGALGFGMVRWEKMMKDSVEYVTRDMPNVGVDDPLAILYTGGTTGRNKGAIHTSRSFNSTSMGMIELSGVLGEGTTMMAEMPMFHGFGLCTCVHLPICIGLRIILIPTFTLDLLCKTIVKKKVNYIAGVPTMFEKMIENKHLQNADLSFIKGIFCGGDAISIESKAKVDEFLAEHGCKTWIRVGYGCTECLTATALTPKFLSRPGSVGVPIPGFKYKIVSPGTFDEVPDGENGEICLCGPSVMLEYSGQKSETDNVLKKHADGNTWLHTGDGGYIDDGFIFFRNRIKRIIITSGYNVFPSQVEEILNHHPLISASCVIGIPDAMRGAKVKAVIVLKDGVDKSQETINSIKQHMVDNICSYAKPREYEFVDSLPRTKLGKVDYMKLERDYQDSSSSSM